MKKSIVVVGIVTLLIGISLTFKKEEKELINITNNENNTLAFFIEEEGNYKGVETLPTSGYTLNEEKSFCSNGAQPTWSDNSLEILSLNSSNTNCYLYFDENCGTVCKTILDNITVNEGTPNFGVTACAANLANGYPCGDTTAAVYKTQDDDGDTYYWRGSAENNYVKFANKFWRIIRINGDGTIRIIYDGESARANGTTLNVETSKFNISNSDNMYVGLKYTSGEVHGTGTKSTILEALETWYNNNIASYASKIDTNAGFCGDRTPSTNSTTSNGEGGTGTTTTYYGGHLRLVTNKTPVLTCPREDLYTVTGATKGNKSLDYPIGLITADEVNMAGGINFNYGYYLYTGKDYWTMTPASYDKNYSYPATVFNLIWTGGFQRGETYAASGVRPVINLRSDVELTGTGTMSDPYVVVGGN